MAARAYILFCLGDVRIVIVRSSDGSQLNLPCSDRVPVEALSPVFPLPTEHSLRCCYENDLFVCYCSRPSSSTIDW